VKPQTNTSLCLNYLGPTCDSLDKFLCQFSLPADVHEGDWLEFDRIGAYSNACATHFNGFYPKTFVGVEGDPFYSPQYSACSLP